jgi:hypothetical protein
MRRVPHQADRQLDVTGACAVRLDEPLADAVHGEHCLLLDILPRLWELACPMVSAATVLDADQIRREVGVTIWAVPGDRSEAT